MQNDCEITYNHTLTLAHTHIRIHTRTVRAATLDKIIWQESIKFYAFNVLANCLSAVCVSLKLHTHSWHPFPPFPPLVMLHNCETVELFAYLTVLLYCSVFNAHFERKQCARFRLI